MCIFNPAEPHIKSQQVRSTESAKRTSCETTRAREARGCKTTSVRSRQGARSAASSTQACASTGLCGVVLLQERMQCWSTQRVPDLYPMRVVISRSAFLQVSAAEVSSHFREISQAISGPYGPSPCARALFSVSCNAWP